MQEAGQHGIGNGADAGLDRRQRIRHAAAPDFVLEEFDQVVGDLLRFRIRCLRVGRAVRRAGDDDGGDLFRWHVHGGRADAVADARQRQRLALGAPVRNPDVVQTFEFRRLRQVELDDDLFGEDGKTGRIAHRRTRHDAAVFGDRHRFQHGHVEVAVLAGAQEFHRFRQVLVGKHHLAAVDGRPQGGIDLERHPPRQHAGFDQDLVRIVSERRAGDQGDLERLLLCPAGQCHRNVLGIAGAGKAAHPDNHAILDQAGGFIRTHDTVEQ